MHNRAKQYKLQFYESFVVMCKSYKRCNPRSDVDECDLNFGVTFKNDGQLQQLDDKY